jgi:hypothetical protein
MMRVLFIAVLLLAVAAAGPAWAEQTRCRVFDTHNAGGPGNNERRMEACNDYCKRLSGGLDGMLRDGWTVESTRPGVVISVRPFKTNMVGVPDEGYCICRGAEYILKR